MEDKTYEIKIPKVKKASYTETPYISKNPVLRFLDFFDFGLPYKNLKFKLLMVPVYFVMGGIVGILMAPLDYFFNKASDGFFAVGVYFVVGMLFTLKKRDVKSYGFIFWGLYGEEVNVERILRYVGIYLIYFMPTVIGVTYPIFHQIDNVEDGLSAIATMLLCLFIPIIPYCVKSEDKKE